MEKQPPRYPGKILPYPTLQCCYRQLKYFSGVLHQNTSSPAHYKNVISLLLPAPETSCHTETSGGHGTFKTPHIFFSLVIAVSQTRRHRDQQQLSGQNWERSYLARGWLLLPPSFPQPPPLPSQRWPSPPGWMQSRGCWAR